MEEGIISTSRQEIDAIEAALFPSQLYLIIDPALLHLLALIFEE